MINFKTCIDYLDIDLRKKMRKPILSINDLYQLLKKFTEFKIDFNFIIGYPLETNNILKKYLQEFGNFIKYFKTIINRVCLYTYFKAIRKDYFQKYFWRNKNSDYNTRMLRCKEFVELAKVHNINVNCNQVKQ